LEGERQIAASRDAAKWVGRLGRAAGDVALGMRLVSHNALAMLGLVAVVSVVYLAGRPDVRYGLEVRAFDWLGARVAARASVGDDAAEDSGKDVLVGMADPEAIQRATAADPAALNRQQAAVAYWIARRYSVAPEPISRLVQEAWEVGHKARLDPTLVLAVMAVESGFNPFAQSHVGAQGLMQVMTRIHHDKYQVFGGMNAAFDPVTNLRVGVQVLKDCIARAGSLEGGLKYYVGAANLAYDGGYSAKVLAEAAYLRKVADGVKVAVNSPLPLPQPVLAPVPAPEVTPVVATPEATVGAGVHNAVAPAAGPVQAPAAASNPLAAPVRRHADQVAMLTPTS
jgi:hypothetical protein